MTAHELLRVYAQKRKALHCNDLQSLKTTVDQEYIALVGEDVFGLTYGYKLDLSPRLYGDGGVDFYTSLGTVDVKTYLKPYHMVLEVGKENQCADILVLAKYNLLNDTAVLIGWDYGSVIKTYPKGILPKQKILNYIEPANKLHSMKEFTDLHMKARING